MGFLGREVQSVLGFLKGKTSSFFSLIFAVCVDTAMSRQDIFLLLVKVFHIRLYVYFFVDISEHWIFFYFAVL